MYVNSSLNFNQSTIINCLRGYLQISYNSMHSSNSCYLQKPSRLQMQKCSNASPNAATLFCIRKSGNMAGPSRGLHFTFRVQCLVARQYGGHFDWNSLNNLPMVDEQ